MNQDLKIIKKKYGENMAHLCRTLFPTLLETEGVLSKVLRQAFNEDRLLYDTIVNNNKEEEFKSYVYSYVDVEAKNNILEIKTPQELMELAGYDLYECKSEEDIQSFKKYYSAGEELCTFIGGRLRTDYVFWAVKKNVNDIRRENFTNPTRQDEYGTSVISIQFSRKNYYLSIKNRYNHRVNNPDATFSNNLDAIIPGLDSSFERTYGFASNSNSLGFDLPNYTRTQDGKFFRYDYEIENVYFCPNNVVVNQGMVKQYDPNKFILIDKYILIDLSNKEITSFVKESFIDYFNDKKITKIDVVKIGEYKEITIIMENGEVSKIKLDRDNQIIGYYNPYLDKTADGFLFYNECMRELSLPNLEIAGDNFLSLNKVLEKLDFPNLEVVGDEFLRDNETICGLDLPKLKKVGDLFFNENKVLQKIGLPNLEVVGDNFLCDNLLIQELKIPKVKKIGSNFLCNNKSVCEIDLPNLEMVGNYFLYFGGALQKVVLENLKETGDEFMGGKNSIHELYLPNLEIVGHGFLVNNLVIQKIELPNLRVVGDGFLSDNEFMSEICFPKLTTVGLDFLTNNESIQKLDLPNLMQASDHFLSNNNVLREVSLPNLEEVGKRFLYASEVLERINLPKLKNIYSVYLPNFELVGNCFLRKNNIMQESELHVDERKSR